LPNERLDPALEFVAKIDIYARRCVSLFHFKLPIADWLSEASQFEI
jgi:hypothetical protein